MVDQISVLPSVPMLERMDVDEAECDDCVEISRGRPVEGDNPFDEIAEVFMARADVLGEGSAVTIIFAHQSSLLAKPELNEAGIANDAALQAQEFIQALRAAGLLPQ